MAKTHKVYKFCAVYACFALFLFFSYKTYFKTTSVISIDINPSIELNINGFDRVISIKNINEDGKILSKSLNIMFENYHSAIDKIVENSKITELLSNDGVLSFSVLPYNQKQGQNIINYISNRTQKNKNIYCYEVSHSDALCAKNLGLSYGKYKKYIQIKSMGFDITPDDIRNMSMKKICEIKKICETEGLSKCEKRKNTSEK